MVAFVDAYLGIRVRTVASISISLGVAARNLPTNQYRVSSVLAINGMAGTYGRSRLR